MLCILFWSLVGGLNWSLYIITGQKRVKSNLSQQKVRYFGGEGGGCRRTDNNGYFINILLIFYVTSFIHILFIFYSYFIHILFIFYSYFIHIYSYFIHILFIFYSYFIHILFIFYSYFIHILFIFYSYLIHILFISYSYFIHILFIFSGCYMRWSCYMYYLLVVINGASDSWKIQSKN
jgi:hypothetical protein